MTAARGDAALGGQAAGLRFRIASPAVAAALGGLVFGLLVAAIPLVLLTGDTREINDGGALAVELAALGVGLVVARNRPANPIGWLMLAGALALVLETDAGLYSVLAYHHHHGRLPLAQAAVFLADTWVAGFIVLPLPILLFPDGRLPSRRWRWVLAAYLAAAATVLVSFYVEEAGVLRLPIRVDATKGQSLTTAHLQGLAGWLVTAGTPAAIALPVFWLLSVGAQAAAWRRASGEARQQLKWLMSGAAIAVVSAVANFVAFDLLTGTAQHVVQDISELGVAALPVSIGVGVLKYRLYEIDRLISRTLSYTLLTGVLVGTFTGLVLLTTRVLPFSSPVGVAASTLAAAALFNPLRSRIQRFVDRRFNRARYSADASVASFTAHLRAVGELDAIGDELLRTIDRTLAPARSSLWIGAGRNHQTAAAPEPYRSP